MPHDPTTWLPRVRELQRIAQEGLTYADSPWDVARYVRLRELTAEIADDVLAGLPPADDPARPGSPDPAALTVAARLRAERGYLTPKLDVRGAVLDPGGRLLLVREVSDGRWALPGGWADVGETLTEGVVREVREETGLEVEVDRLVGIFDRERTGHPPMLHHTLKAVLGCRAVGGAVTPSAETPEVEWFDRDALPPLSLPRTSPELLARVFAHHDDPALPPEL